MKQGYLKRMGILCLAAGLMLAAGCGKAETQEAEENTFNTEAEVIAWEEEEQADKGENGMNSVQTPVSHGGLKAVFVLSGLPGRAVPE